MEPAIVNVKDGNSTFSTKTSKCIKDEAVMFRSFDHPTIPVVVQLKEDVIMFPVIVGKSLASWVPKFPGLTDSQKNSICLSLLLGLRHIHEILVVHGRINPDNIYVHDRNIKPVYINFESSFMNGEATNVVDNGFFTSPETRRSRIMTCKSDVFSLGMVFASLTIGKIPDEWAVDYNAAIDMATAAVPPWNKAMLHVDARARGMADTVLQFMGDVPTPCRNPFHAALHSALSFNDARRLQGWKDLSEIDANQPWDVALKPMLVFIYLAFEFPIESDQVVLSYVISTLYRASVFPGGLSTIKNRIQCSELENFFIACFRANRDATIAFINTCAAANVIDVTEEIFSVMMDTVDSSDQVVTLIRLTTMSPGAAKIITRMHAGAKRKADDASRANESAAEAFETIAAIQKLPAFLRLQK